MAPEVVCQLSSKKIKQGAVALAQNPIVYSRSKHIDIHFNFIRKAQEEGNINIVYCLTFEMVTDLLTNPISSGPV